MEKKYTPAYIQDEIVNHMIDQLLRREREPEEIEYGPDHLSGWNTFLEARSKFVDGVKTAPSASSKTKSAAMRERPASLEPIEPTRLKSVLREKVIAKVFCSSRHDHLAAGHLDPESVTILLSYKGKHIYIPVKVMANELKKGLLGMKLFDFQRCKLLVAVFAMDPNSLGLQ